MKPAQAPSVSFLLAALAFSGACSAEEDGKTSSNPVVTPPGGMGAMGAAGGATGGAALGGGNASGGTAAGGALPGGSPGSTGSTVGGATAGGAMSVVIEMMGPCEKKVRTAGKTVPDFMIVLDRSQSMKPDCTSSDIAASFECRRQNIRCDAAPHMGTTICGGTMPNPLDRWTPAVSAIKSLTQMFETKVNFGLTVFPGPGEGQGSECSTGTQRVPVGPGKAMAIASELDMTQPTGRTPTGPTLDAVLQQIKAKKADPDSQVPPQYVLLVTDGSPTCPGMQTMNNQQAHQATISAIDALAKEGVKTYVIGYDASVDATLAAQLTEYAKHGGTNDFFAVQDGPSLVAQFTSITGVVAECSYMLDKKPDDNRYVLVELDGKKLDLNDPNGWSINERNVTIEGEACTTLRDGSKPHTLAVTVECVPQVLN